MGNVYCDWAMISKMAPGSSLIILSCRVVVPSRLSRFTDFLRKSVYVKSLRSQIEFEAPQRPLWLIIRQPPQMQTTLIRALLASLLLPFAAQSQTIGTSNIKNSAVTTAKLTNYAVTTVKLATNAVTTINITNAAVSTAKIQ